MYTVLMAGFITGFAGSLHCIGMCGPLSLAMPVWHLSPLQKFFSLLLYQLGRIITYTALGLVFGLVGRTIHIAGFQQWVSIFLGVVVLLMATMYFLRRQTVHFSFAGRFYGHVQQLIVHILKSNKHSSGFFLLGMANGLLPCGMVYIAIAAALSSTTIAHSTGLMAAFGAGTLPAMMAVGYGGQMISPQIRKHFNASIPFFITAAGIILILRGMNLGITFISPVLPGAAGEIISCHK